MKKILDILLFFLILWIFLPSNSYGGKYLDLIAGEIKQIVHPQLIKEEPKNAILIFTSNGCAPCKLLEKNVLMTPDFQEFIKTNNIDLFTINISQNFKAAQDWGVTNTPAMRFIKYRSDQTSILLERQVGYTSKEAIFSLLKRIYNIKKEE